MNEFGYKVGRVIRTIRKQHKESQASVGAFLGKDQGQISRIERGLEDIRLSEINRFCLHFGISIVDFAAKVEYEGPPPPSMRASLRGRGRASEESGL